MRALSWCLQYCLDQSIGLCIDLCMATKTVSLDLDAYRKLRKAKKNAKESFSSVVKRAIWVDEPRNSLAVLENSKALPMISEESLQYLEKAQESDLPPEAKWAD